MTKKIIKDKQIRETFKKNEIKKLALKFLANTHNVDKKIQHNFNLALTELPKNSSITRIKNRCIITGRSHGVYKKLKLSRILLKEYISLGLLSGFTKSSW